MVKTRERADVPADKLEAFAAGAEGDQPKDTIARKTISLPRGLLTRVEDLALANKRSGAEDRSVSAIVRRALESYL